MSPPIGSTVSRETGRDTMIRARARAELIPDLLVEAQRVANNVYAGWHGRRKRGVGENFWQFRPYTIGENLAAIDWRKSARDDHIYVRDREWQAAHTVWIWVDESPSMLFKSELGSVSKQSRGLVLAFALAELLARSGERLGWFGVTKPIVSRNAAERLAEALVISPQSDVFPADHPIGTHSDIVLISDFLDTLEEVKSRTKTLSNRGARGHLVHMIDPVEETFPYNGRTEFLDPESGDKLIAGNASVFQSDYTSLFNARSDALARHTRNLGWSYTTHHTDRLASQALLSLHENLSVSGSTGRGR